jgi:hypothetical protein
MCAADGSTTASTAVTSSSLSRKILAGSFLEKANNFGIFKIIQFHDALSASGNKNIIFIAQQFNKLINLPLQHNFLLLQLLLIRHAIEEISSSTTFWHLR